MERVFGKIVLFVLAGFVASWLLSFTPIFEGLFSQYKQLMDTLVRGAFNVAIYAIPAFIVGSILWALIQQNGVLKGGSELVSLALKLALFLSAIGIMVATPLFLNRIPWVHENIPFGFVWLGGLALGSPVLFLAYRIVDGPEKKSERDE